MYYHVANTCTFQPEEWLLDNLGEINTKELWKLKSKPWTFFRIIQMVLHQNFVIITSCLMNKKCFSLHVRVTTYFWIQYLPQWLKIISANWCWNGSLAAINKKALRIGRTNYKFSLKNKHVLFESSHTLQAIYFGVGLGVHSTSNSSEGTLQLIEKQIWDCGHDSIWLNWKSR
jgi:hypothetical protein